MGHIAAKGGVGGDVRVRFRQIFTSDVWSELTAEVWVR